MNFRHWIIGFLISTTILVHGVMSGRAKDVAFDVNYGVKYGADHISYLNQRTEVQLSLHDYTGAGFISKRSYGSGYFHIRMKLPNKDSGGVVTTFYLTSKTNYHDELDFEFLGNREGKPITIQTNVFVNGAGGREQRIHLWFDPTADFHTYEILWNEHQVVFFVDNTPIRVFKNITNHGVSYPTQPMRIIGTIWDGSEWATDGGKTKIDWSHQPFVAHYQGFSVDGCLLAQSSSNNHACYSSNIWYNQPKYWKLHSKQQQAYENVRQKYMYYDYCTDWAHYPVPPPDCQYNS